MSEPLYRHRYEDGRCKVAVLRSYDKDCDYEDSVVYVGDGYDFSRSPYEQEEELRFPVGSNQTILEITEENRFVVAVSAKPGCLLRGGLKTVRSTPFTDFSQAEDFGEAMIDQPNSAGFVIRMIKMKTLKGVTEWGCTQGLDATSK